MSWKLFWQIVLLIVIAVFISSVVKSGMLRCGYKGKMMRHHSGMMQKGTQK